MRGLINRLEAVRHVDLAIDVLQAVPAHRVSRMAQEGRRMTAQNFEQMRPGRRYATLATFLLEMEMALEDAAIAMFEVLIAKAFRRAEAERDKQLLETATSATSALDFFVSFGESIATRRDTGLSLDEVVNAVGGWEQLMQATAAAKAASRNRKDDDLMALLSAQMSRYPAEVDGVPMDDGTDHQVEAGSPEGLTVKGAITDFAALVEKDGAFQLVGGLALVEPG